MKLYPFDKEQLMKKPKGKGIIKVLFYFWDKELHNDGTTGIPENWGCCCTCEYQAKLKSHAWHTTLRFETLPMYVCTVATDMSLRTDDKTPDVTILGKHGCCEMYSNIQDALKYARNKEDQEDC